MDLIPSRYFDSLFDDLRLSKIENSMKCDIYEEGNKYFIEIDLPGVKKEDIKIEAKDKYLTIKATKSEESLRGDDSRNYIHRERNYGCYERTFYLDDLSDENIEASFTDGILKIEVLKKDSVEKKNFIEIK